MSTIDVGDLRRAADAEVDKLLAQLDTEGHGEDCILRCFESPNTCRADHACDVCADEEEDQE